MRSHFIKWLCNTARHDKRIILLTADLGYSVIEPFADQFPDRFINVGIAEQNMVGIAAGLASEGFRPYTYSIGIFPTFRCAEQLRNDIDYHRLPVCTCTVGSGVAYGLLGYSHHAVQDIALMRSLPNTTIATPSDPLEVSRSLDWQLDVGVPMYLRMHKNEDPLIHKQLPDLTLGKPLYITKRKNISKKSGTCFLAIGILASKALDLIKKYNFSVDFYTLPIWDSSSNDNLIDMLRNYNRVITIEDHLLQGGMSSWLMEILAINNLKLDVEPICLESSLVGKVASEDTFLKPVISRIYDALLLHSNS